MSGQSKIRPAHTERQLVTHLELAVIAVVIGAIGGQTLAYVIRRVKRARRARRESEQQ